MSSSHPQQSLIERYWQVLVILFGVLFVAILLAYNPHG